MTAPTAPAPIADGGSLEGLTDSITSESFISQVVKDYEAGNPDPNKPTPATDEHATIGDFGEPGQKEKESPKVDPAKTVKPDAGEGGGGEKAEEPAAEPDASGEPRKLATDFKLIDADGDELDVDDVMGKVQKIAFTYKGELRELPLDRVVRLAQSGIHNEDLYQQATDAIGHFETLETEVSKANESIVKQNKFIERLLSDDDFRAQIQDQYARFNTPEARAERAERQLAEMQAKLEGQSKADVGISFLQSDVRPALKALLTQYPKVTSDELEGAFNRMTAKFGQVIDPRHFPAVKAILAEDLPAYAAGIHESRATADTAVRKAKEQTTLLKRRVAQGARPTGRRPTADELKPKPRTPRSDDEKLDQLLDKALS